jgi:hypothetical protein
MKQRALIALIGSIIPVITQAASSYLLQDTLVNKQLEEVVVTSQEQYTTAKKSAYIPTVEAKKAAQSGVDLLERMGIPQIQVDPQTQAIQSAAGQTVSTFINFVPCTSQELSLMPIADVTRVDYYDYPSDPRFQGKTRVLNFIVKKNDSGGYAKVSAEAGVPSKSGFAQGLVRYQHRKMTYDLMGLYRQKNDDHLGSTSLEQFDFGESPFSRHTSSDASKYRQRYGQLNFRALYNSDHLTADNSLSGGIERTPYDDYSGTVHYEGITNPASSYSSQSNSRNRFLSYSGYYYFKLTDAASLTSNLTYTYSKTKEHSLYDEGALSTILNRADDTSHDFNGYLRLSINLHNNDQIGVHGKVDYSKSDTEYAGSATAFDSADILYGQTGVSYSLSRNHLYGEMGLGWGWEKSTINTDKSTSSEPYMDLYVQYSPTSRHSLSLEFHYSEFTPSPNLKSEVVRQVSPYVWNTGNPLLDADRNYDAGLTYNFLPSNTWNLTAFTYLWANTNRYAYVYQPMADGSGVLRTVQQPSGSYVREQVGLSSRVKLFHNAVTLNGNLTQTFLQNHAPYNYDLRRLTYWLSAYWYIKDFNVGVMYKSQNRSSASNGYNTIVKTRDVYTLSVGWAKQAWNVRLRLQNLLRWDWRDTFRTSQYEGYNVQSTVFDNTQHANATLSATYTLNFGRKQVDKKNESQEWNRNSSGILR